jgi:hypothetical protein
MRKIVLKMGFNAFSGLHEGLVLFEKIYLNPRSQIGLIWENLFEKYVCNLRVQRLMDLHGV